MASEQRNYPDFVFVAYDEDFSAQTHDVAVSLEAGNLVGTPVKYIRHDLNTRLAPAATDTGLVTVAWQDFVPSTGWVASSPSSIAKDKRELVTRSQAEELLAAEREKALFLKTAMEIAQTHCGMKDKTIASLEADNAALIHDLNRIKDHETELVNDNVAQAARIKELEAERSEWSEEFAKRGLAEASEGRALARIADLEAKLAAAEKALEPFADHAKDRAVDAAEWRNSDTVQIVVTIGDLRKARAVLGGKPS